MPKVPLVVMLLAHRRPQLLPLIVQQVSQRWPDAVVQITVDRPSASVVSACIRAEDLGNVETFAAPHPAVSDRERFMELRNWQLEQLEKHEPNYVALWDDDHVLEGTNEPADRMREGYDLIYADKVYFWDGPRQYNAALPRHRSPLFFKWRRGDRYPLNRTISAPMRVHDDPTSTKIVLMMKLLDFGYMNKHERERVFNIYKQAGKIDDLTLGLMKQPDLKPFRSSLLYYRKFVKAVE